MTCLIKALRHDLAWPKTGFGLPSRADRFTGHSWSQTGRRQPLLTGASQ